MKLFNTQNFINNQKLVDRLISCIDFDEAEIIVDTKIENLIFEKSGKIWFGEINKMTLFKEY